MAIDPLSGAPIEPSDLEKAFMPPTQEQIQAAAERRESMRELVKIQRQTRRRHRRTK